MAAPERAVPQGSNDWVLSGLLLLAIGVAAGGLNSVIADVAWWLVLMAVATIVLAAGAAVRSFARHRLWGTLASFVAAVATMTLLFSPQNAILGLIPTFDTLATFRGLEAAGVESIVSQGIPADADQGIVYLLCLGIAAIAFAMDTAAFAFRTPALTGLPLLVLLLVPSMVDPGLDDAIFFALTALAWIAILLVRSRPAARRAALGIAGAGVVGALIIPAFLPAVQQTDASNGLSAGIATGLNPILTLGNDLRLSDPRLVLTYTTTVVGGQYLRLTTVDEFTGTAWEPTSTEVIPGNDVAAIGPPPGLGEAIPTTRATTDIVVGNVATRWLPAPYAPSTIAGLVGEWSWEPDGLAIRTERSNARGQEYSVESLQPAPSIEQLMAAGTTVEAGMERYLQVPEGLPPIVGATALEVVGDAATNYEKAVALQDFFRSGEFVYSEEAPVEQGYDGSGASVLDAFLDVKAGYCVQFASAMASMTRTLGIPTRIAVGFTAGEAVTDESGQLVEYRVTTRNFHTWPELYFAGIGWVRFEPTPGRGEVPAFAPLTRDDPATPNVDESVPTPATTAGSSAAPILPPEDPTPTETPVAVSPGVAGNSVQWWWVLVAALASLVAAPWALRAIRRARRLGEAARGSATAAWEEVRDTADDLGLRTTDARTPRQLATDLSGQLDDGGARALARLRIAVESEAFADREGDPDPGDVRVVSRSLRRRAGLGRRLVAAMLPRSIFAPWLPQASRAE